MRTMTASWKTALWVAGPIVLSACGGGSRVDEGAAENAPVPSGERCGPVESTLPDDAFNRFPKTTCSEVHLATGFQNLVYDHIPDELREEMIAWVWENKGSTKKDSQTDEQFVYSTRKQAIGPFKEKLWALPEELLSEIRSVLEEKFAFLFEQLNVGDTTSMVHDLVQTQTIRKPLESFVVEKVEAEDTEGLSD